jgi:hypothetical protein
VVRAGTDVGLAALAQSLNFLNQRRARHTESSGSARYIATARRERLVDQTRFELSHRRPKVDRRVGAAGRTEGANRRCSGAVQATVGIL